MLITILNLYQLLMALLVFISITLVKIASNLYSCRLYPLSITNTELIITLTYSFLHLARVRVKYHF